MCLLGVRIFTIDSFKASLTVLETLVKAFVLVASSLYLIESHNF